MFFSTLSVLPSWLVLCVLSPSRPFFHHCLVINSLIRMSIVVQLVSVLSRTIQLQGLKSYNTVWHVKVLLDMKESIPTNHQIIFFNGTEQEDQKTLAASKVGHGSTLYVFLRPSPEPSKESVSEMTVKMPDWKPVTMEVQPWYTARHVKALMQSLTSLISLDQYLLYHCENLLNNDNSIQFSRNESPIYLVFPPAKADHDQALVTTCLEQDCVGFYISVCGCGWEEYLWVTKSSTVNDIKKMIEKVADIESNQQILFHKRNMVRLDQGDDKTLHFYAVDKGSALYVLGLSPKISIRVPQVRDTVSIKSNGIKYVSDIKDGVFEKLGIPQSSQTLVYKGQLLEDSQVPEACNDIEEKAVVYAIIGSDDQTNELALNLKDSGYPCDTIKVKRWYTILDFKTIIESRFGVPICVQELVFKDLLLRDWKHLSDYNITNRDYILVKLKGSPVKLIINVSDGGEGDKNKDNVVIEAENTNTIDDILCGWIPAVKIEKIYGEPCLFHNNNALLGNKMLAHYGINLSSCNLSLDKLVEVNVTRADGKTRKVILNPSFDIKSVKQMVQQKCGIPYELLRLSYPGDDGIEHEAEDELTLAHYEAVLGSLLDLRWKFAGGSWSFFWPSFRGHMLDADLDVEQEK